jgi:hypothetical protein
MKHTIGMAMAAMAIGLWSSPGSAAPIAYDEATSGDIIDDVTEFALDFGINTVTGTVNGASLQGATDPDFDNFHATLPANAILESIAVSVSDAVGGNGDFANLFQAASQEPRFSNIIVDLVIGTAGDFFVPLDLPLDQLRFVGLNSFPTGMINDYTITLDVVPVPEPAALPLLFSAIAAIGFVRRRQDTLRAGSTGSRGRSGVSHPAGHGSRRRATDVSGASRG